MKMGVEDRWEWGCLFFAATDRIRRRLFTGVQACSLPIKIVGWMADYFKNIEQYPVKSQVNPKEIYNKLPDSAPQKSESFHKKFKARKSAV